MKTDVKQDDQVNVGTNKLKLIADELLAYNVTFEESQRQYRDWAINKNYDELLSDKSRYYAPVVLIAKILELFAQPESSLVLDIGAGTGLIGKMLLDNNFKNIHGLDPLKEFVDIAKSKDVYQKIYNSYIGSGAVVDCPNDTYNAVVACGAFGPGHIPCDSFHEIIRVVKPGGYFINCMRLGHFHNVKEYKDRLEPLAIELEQQGKWCRITWETYTQHFLHHEGLLMVFQIC